MIKQAELLNPESCLNRAKMSDMVFVLKQGDPAMAETIRFWCRKRIELGKNSEGDDQITEALACADYVKGTKNG